MAGWVVAVGAIVGAAASAYSAVSAKDTAGAAAENAEQAARENALMIEAEGLEEEKRARRENQDAQAEMRARSAASLEDTALYADTPAPTAPITAAAISNPVIRLSPSNIKLSLSG